MRKNKRNNKWIILLMLLLLIPGYMGIVHANNHIARSMEAQLLAYPLPPQTELLDSKAIAGKLDGNGNGMQYRGMILVRSSLTGEELQKHYSALNSEECSIWIYPQESQVISYDHKDFWFDVWDTNQPCWRIEMYCASSVGTEETLWQGLLNIDLRGH